MWQKNTFRIFEHLLRHPAEKFNVNQLARELKLSIGSAFKILKDYEKRKVLKSEKLANSIFYQFDYQNKETQKICELLLINLKNYVLEKNPVASLYVEELASFKAEAIMLFGSILVKKEQAHDVDVLFIIKDKKEIKKISDFCLEISKTRTKPVIPLILTENDLKEKIKQKDKVILEIFKTSLVLSGEEVIIKTLGGL